jgi:hypothetical protein
MVTSLAQLAGFVNEPHRLLPSARLCLAPVVIALRFWRGTQRFFLIKHRHAGYYMDQPMALPD